MLVCRLVSVYSNLDCLDETASPVISILITAIRDDAAVRRKINYRRNSRTRKGCYVSSWLLVVGLVRG